MPHSLVSLEIFHVFLSSADFFKREIFRKILSGIPLVSNSLEPDIRPDLGPNCLQRLSVDNRIHQKREFEQLTCFYLYHHLSVKGKGIKRT